MRPDGGWSSPSQSPSPPPAPPPPLLTRSRSARSTCSRCRCQRNGSLGRSERIQMETQPSYPAVIPGELILWISLLSKFILWHNEKFLAFILISVHEKMLGLIYIITSIGSHVIFLFIIPCIDYTFTYKLIYWAIFLLRMFGQFIEYLILMAPCFMEKIIPLQIAHWDKDGKSLCGKHYDKYIYKEPYINSDKHCNIQSFIVCY